LHVPVSAQTDELAKRQRDSAKKAGKETHRHRQVVTDTKTVTHTNTHTHTQRERERERDEIIHNRSSPHAHARCSVVAGGAKAGGRDHGGKGEESAAEPWNQQLAKE
jgi:hypothetical protein